MRPFADPRWSYLDTAATARVQEVDPALRVMFDGRRERFVVLDTEAPGGTDHQIVLIVQEPSGAFRPFDGRTLETLRKLRPEHRDLINAELDTNEAKRRAEWERRTAQLAEGMADDLRHVGTQIAPSVAWRDRSIARETIRRAALEN